MKFEDLKVGLRMISPQGDIFEVCGIDTLKEEASVKVVEFSTKDHIDEDPMDRYGHEFTAGNSGWISKCGRFVLRRGFYEVCYRDLSLWYDDIPNFKEGDIVKDLDGNKYKIAFVGSVRAIPDIYKLELLDLRNKYSTRQAQLGIAFEDIGDVSYVYNSQNDAVLNDDYSGIYQLFATELKLVEEVLFTTANAETTKSPRVPSVTTAPSVPRYSIDEIREITANAENFEINKLMDIAYSSILEAARKGICKVSVNATCTFADLKVIEHLRSEGFTVNDFTSNFEIEW